MKIILFDLDGTIIDSSEGITKGVQEALNYFGIEEQNLKNLESFIGPPLSYAFSNFYNLNEEGVLTAVEKYRKYYQDKGVYQINIYKGIEELLRTLKEQNYKILLATAKPEFFAIQILDNLGISKYFDYIAGALMDGRTDKSEVIKYALNSAKISTNDGKIIMVGDRKYDIIGARQSGIDAIGVLYGFGSREELEAENPLKIVESVEHLKTYLLNI